MGLLIPLFWTSGDVCLGFQSQGGFLHLRASLPVHNRFLRFTSGVIPADCIEVYKICLVQCPNPDMTGAKSISLVIQSFELNHFFIQRLCIRTHTVN